MCDLIAKRNALLESQMESLHMIQLNGNSALKSARKSSNKVEATVSQELQKLASDADFAHQKLMDMTSVRVLCFQSTFDTKAHTCSPAAHARHLAFNGTGCESTLCLHCSLH